ncbi:MAG TPA: hypothetical protein DCX03_07500 [Bacteroidales bacterium]|nr:hypothetical protein [Bacteroidales bacterium]
MQKTLKILIGCCGGLTGLYVAKRLESLVTLFGFDSCADCATKKYIKQIETSPSLNNEEEFIDFLIGVSNKLDIDIYIPTYSKEIRLVSKNKAKLSCNCKMRFLVSEYSTIMQLEDKLNAYKALKDLGIDTPRIVNPNFDDTNFPVYVKPIIGSGTKDNFVIDNKEQWASITKKNINFFAMEYIQGVEYTVDAFFKSNGKLHDYNQRQRIKTAGGAAIITKNNFDVSIDDYIEKLQKNYHFVGPINIQFFFTRDNRKVLIDINLRMASGGMPLSIESGLDIPQMIIRECLGESIEPFYSDRKNRTMYRYYEEYFI